MKIICVGSHPDDVELAMGGTAAFLSHSGHEILFADLSDGEPTPRGDRETRILESSESAEILKVKRILLNNRNRYFEDTVSARESLAEVFREFRPGLIFTHFPYDAHPDHISACRITDAARFYSKLTKTAMKGEPYYPPKIIYYFPNHIHLNIIPSFCSDTAGYSELKFKALCCYRSQFPEGEKSELLKRKMETDRYFGIRVGSETAEPFYSRESLNIQFLSEVFKRR
ncbi:MAG TPA: PIG-L family deacetylase [Leptospiraceae bacterium]|nr:PIG-L family deacetylase [Leptospiraceae bacterium]HMZ61322.1 PIG-L family deacetylase [Leptospiraceae bacterium]HNF13036.1 PIG-L family deacetylase [Leptospiraceae bacterium]HNF27353.1 PIG-L family deacetylase [Leptospiraceae bacterium]HNM02543.1 PIG-L family deacetylase [Leptospiraceae bacterium]